MTLTEEERKALNESTADGLFEEHATEEEEAEEEIEESEVEEDGSGSPEEEPAPEVGRIPYSRFEKVNEAKIRAEERLAILEEQIKGNNNNSNQEITPDEEWLEMWGDTPEARQAYLLDQKRKERDRIEMTKSILEEIENREASKQTELEANLEYIEDNLANLESTLKRKLTDAEESAILDIQDEFTPKDDKGNYIAPLMAADKAFEVYNLRQNNIRTTKSVARKRVTSITGSSNDGESNGSSSSDYNPSAWGGWRKALGE